MTPEETVAYYDDSSNAAYMCALLMNAHPGWLVYRARGALGVPLWYARRQKWRRRPPLISDNAGTLNHAMFTADEGLAA